MVIKNSWNNLVPSSNNNLLNQYKNQEIL